MGSQKNIDMSINPDDLEKLEAAKQKAQKQEAKTDQGEADDQEPEQTQRERSQAYKSAKSIVDRTKWYKTKQAVELVKKTSYSSFAGTITADATVKDSKLNLETSFPHKTGKTQVVEIASEKTFKKIEDNSIDFDILLAEPKMMKKIAKYARILGPQGLMPNPKNNTVVDNPEERKKELEKGLVQISTERKAPLIHVTIGKTDQPTEEIIENLEHLITTIGPKKFKKLTIAATMSPGVKIDLKAYQGAQDK